MVEERTERKKEGGKEGRKEGRKRSPSAGREPKKLLTKDKGCKRRGLKREGREERK